MHQSLKHLWPLPLLIGGCAISFLFWPSTLAFISLLLSLLLLLPLVIVSLVDVRRAKRLQPQPAFLEMNLPPPRPLFIGPIADALDRFVGFFVALEGLGLFIALLAGVGLLGYVVVSWILHFVGQGQLLAAGTTGALGLFAAAAAFARIPAAQILVFGSAAVCGTAFLSGYGNVLLP